MHQHAWLVLLSLLVACTSTPPATREQVTALRGTITDATGAPLAGVSATAGSVHATSSASGVYELRVAAGERVVSFEHAGFVRSFERVSVVAESPTQLDVTLLPMAAAIPLDASLGGTITAARGASIVAPPMAFVDASGAAVTGMVDVHLTPIDPSVGPELAASPGDFTGDMAGTTVPLESLGMMDITVEASGARLQVAPGATLEIHIPAAAGAAAPDAQAPVWSFDETTGVWSDEGMATLDSSSGTYIATTHHMSIWNIDKPYLATCVCGTVVEHGAGPLPGARVDANGLDYFGTSEATTDANGHFCIAVRKSSRVSIAAYHASGGGTSIEITSGTADTMVPPDASDARCVDIGTLEVERDVFHGAGGTLACADVTNPFADACGNAVWTLFSCYDPNGACMTVSEASGMLTTTYANGAHSVSTTTIAGAHTEMYGSTGTLCGSSMVGTDAILHYTTSDGAMFTMSVPEGATGDVVIGCPDGSMQHVTPAQREAIQACNPDTGSSSMCTFTGPTMGNCAVDGDCAAMGAGFVCCAVPSAGNYCLPSDTCAML